MEDLPADQGPADPGFWAKHFPWLTGHAQTKRNAFCSFCRKSYKDVGPLVEGPDEVYICYSCIKLCESIIQQEHPRRGMILPGEQN